MMELWEWSATDALGKSRGYQTYGPDVSESSMLAHLRAHYPHTTITGLKRVEPRDLKPRIGTVQSHTFQNGIMDAVRKELGLIPAARRQSLIESLLKRTDQPAPTQISSIRDRFRTLRNGPIAALNRQPITR